MELWNVVTSVWLPPHAYAPKAMAFACPEEAKAVETSAGALPSRPWELLAEALLDLLEFGSELPEPPLPEPGSDANEEYDDEHDQGKDVGGAEGAGGGPKVVSLTNSEAPKVKIVTEADKGDGNEDDEDVCEAAVVDSDGLVKIDLDWTSQVVTYAMSCLTMAKQWDSVMDIGNRLLSLTLDHTTAAEGAYPLMLHAQNALVKIARRKKELIDADVALHEQHVAEADAKRRAKNKYKSRVVKERVLTSEEKQLMAEGQVLTARQGDATADLMVRCCVGWCRDQAQGTGGSMVGISLRVFCSLNFHALT